MTRTFPRLLLVPALALATLLLVGADGCASDPNVEGAKLEMRNNDHARALELVNLALETNPDNVQALTIKGQALTQIANDERDPVARRPLVEEALMALNRAQELTPEPDADVQNAVTTLWINEMQAGSRSFQRGAEDQSAYMAAAESFKNAGMILPDSTDGHFNAGLAFIAAGSSESAIEPLEMAVANGDADADAYTYLARVYVEQAANAEAAEMTEKAAEMNSKASATLEAGVAAYPGDEGLQIELLNALQRAGEMDRAMATYEDIIASNPDNAQYVYNYGSLLLQANRYEEAQMQLMKAVELYEAQGEPSARALFNLGASFQNEAVDLYDQIEEMDANADAAEIEQLEAQRTELFETALPHYEAARELNEANGDDASQVCNALFQVYAQLRMDEQARDAAECAGIDLN
ncbi:MAG: tetratricopeptide repeat protein [Bacteroidota bacterium]